MDYEQKYKDALELAREFRRQAIAHNAEAEVFALESIFPELRESEDERIRRELIEYLRGDLDDITTDDTDRWIAWLEKQKEQNPAEKSSMLKILKEHLANTPREQLDAEFEALKDLTIDKPSWKPGEEQMAGLLVAIGDEKERGSDVVKTLRSLYEQLKKL